MTIPHAPSGSRAALRVALIGDYDPTVTAHQAIPLALRLASSELRVGVDEVWVPTDTVPHDADGAASHLASFDAVWCIPASPYASTEGALAAIRYARERSVPFLGTCGGFQHALLEYAQSVWGERDAAHAELDPSAADPVIAPLACSLVEEHGSIRFRPGSRLAAVYDADEAVEEYHCRYGLNPRYVARLSGPLRATAHDDAGEVRAVELDDHPFYVATLFQPERRALRRLPCPLPAALVAAAAAHAATRAAAPA